MNNVVEKFKNGRNIQQNKSSGIRKMQTAAGGPLKKPRIKLNGLWRELNYEGNGNFSTLTENGKMSFTTGKKSPRSIVGNKEIVVTPEKTTVLDKQDNTKNYYSAYNPDDIVKGFNALTLGGLNNLSPTQWARRYYDLNQLVVSLIPGAKRTMTWSGFVNNWLNGNNGLVSEKFAQEHPYWSMGINGVGDIVALGGMANASKINLVGNIVAKHGGDAAKIAVNVAKNSSKPLNLRNYKFLGDSRFYSDLDDAGYKTIMAERLSGNYPLTFAERRNYITGLKSDIQKGVDYAIDEARANLKASLKPGKEVEYTFDGGRGWRLDPYSPEDILPQKIHYGTLKTTKEYGQTPWEGNYGAFQKGKGLFFPFRDEPNTLRTHSMFLDAGERISTGAHETRHTVQSYFDVPLIERRYDMPGTYGRYTNRRLPLDFKKKVNEFINDALTAGEWQGSLAEMDSELTGWSARYGFPRYSQMNPKQKALLYDLFLKRFGGNTDYNESAFKLLNDSKTLNPYAIKREVKKLDDSKIGQIIQGLETLGYRKNGGKMNILEFLKNGSGIHIKKKNKGKFTSYCGGKVTNECIRKAKASGNPTLVKRATFAANARKWKHLEGGQIKIPKNRTLVRTIKINNGILTAERDSNDNLHWFRNGKYITPNLIKTYKFYDPLLKAYRLLTNYYNEYVDRKTVGTKVYTPNLNIIRAKALKADRQKMLNNINQSVPFNGEKITLRTKGKMNLADIPTNLLDSIAINSGRSNTDFFTNSALVGKESTFGGFSKALGNPIPKEHKEQPWHITNNTAYFNNDYSAYNNAFENNRKPGDKVLLRDEANAKYALEHGLIEGKVPLYSNYVLADAFKRYSLNPSGYNPGQSNYALMVNGIKQELMEEKQFLNYWNTRGKEFYNKGKKETMKKGGIIKGASGFKNTLGQINLFLSSDRGKGLLNFGSSLVTGGLLLNNLSKGKLEYFESEDKNVITKGNEAYKNANVDDEVLQYMSWINSLGDNGGDIVRNYISEKLKNNIRFNAMSEAKAEAEENKKKFMNLYNEASNEIYNNAIKSAFDFASTFVNSKNGAPSNDNT